jgi:DNA-binding transcriptional LysR family regulator
VILAGNLGGNWIVKLPPLNALRAFEAAARHGGFTGAADELCVTRGAVSRHVKLLEEHLGVTLFRRLPQGLELTAQGRRFHPVLTDAFGMILRGARSVSADRSELRIICPPTTSIRWLIPKLERFRARRPDVRVNITTEFFEWGDFTAGGFDLGFCGEDDVSRPAELMAQPVFPMLITPACSPALLEGPAALRCPEDLAKVTLLQEDPDGYYWSRWLGAFGVKGVDPLSGEYFPNLDMAVKAAVMGLGVVLGDVVLTRDEFETGQLVVPFKDLVCETKWGRICLLGLASQWDEPKVEAFRTWVAEEAARDAEALSLQSWMSG